MTLAVALFVPFRKCHRGNLSVPHYDSFYQQLSVPLRYRSSNGLRHNDSHNLLVLFGRLLSVVRHSFLCAMFVRT